MTIVERLEKLEELVSALLEDVCDLEAMMAVLERKLEDAEDRK